MVPKQMIFYSYAAAESIRQKVVVTADCSPLREQSDVCSAASLFIKKNVLPLLKEHSTILLHWDGLNFDSFYVRGMSPMSPDDLSFLETFSRSAENQLKKPVAPTPATRVEPPASSMPPPVPGEAVPMSIRPGYVNTGGRLLLNHATISRSTAVLNGVPRLSGPIMTVSPGAYPAVDNAMRRPFIQTTSLNQFVPVVTSLRPIVTSVRPVVTSVRPMVTSVRPIVTSVRPIVTSVRPVVTSVRPMVTTVGPMISTVRPAGPIVKGPAPPLQARVAQCAPSFNPIPTTVLRSSPTKTVQVTEPIITNMPARGNINRNIFITQSPNAVLTNLSEATANGGPHDAQLQLSDTRQPLKTCSVLPDGSRSRILSPLRNPLPRVVPPVRLVPENFDDSLLESSASAEVSAAKMIAMKKAANIPVTEASESEDTQQKLFGTPPGMKTSQMRPLVVRNRKGGVRRCEPGQYIRRKDGAIVKVREDYSLEMIRPAKQERRTFEAIVIDSDSDDDATLSADTLDESRMADLHGGTRERGVHENGDDSQKLFSFVSVRGADVVESNNNRVVTVSEEVPKIRYGKRLLKVKKRLNGGARKRELDQDFSLDIPEPEVIFREGERMPLEDIMRWSDPVYGPRSEQQTAMIEADPEEIPDIEPDNAVRSISVPETSCNLPAAIPPQLSEKRSVDPGKLQNAVESMHDALAVMWHSENRLRIEETQSIDTNQRVQRSAPVDSNLDSRPAGADEKKHDDEPRDDTSERGSRFSYIDKNGNAETVLLRDGIPSELRNPVVVLDKMREMHSPAMLTTRSGRKISLNTFFEAREYDLFYDNDTGEINPSLNVPEVVTKFPRLDYRPETSRVLSQSSKRRRRRRRQQSSPWPVSR